MTTDRDDWIKVLAGVLLIPGLVLLVVPFGLYYAWVIRDLWAWFIVPLGVPALTLKHAWGVTMVASLLTKQRIPENKDESAATKWILLISGPALSWVIGYFIR